MGRRIKSLHFNLKEGENVVFHRNHTSKKNQKPFIPKSLVYRRYKLKKKYGKDADQFDI